MVGKVKSKWIIAGPVTALTVIASSYAMPAIPSGDPARGRTLFQQRCAVCHGPGGSGGAVGPRLIGVVGRRAGSTAFRYSPAMKNARRVWDAATLDIYLKAPMASVPGARMALATANPADRRDIISYLETTTDPNFGQR